MQENKNEMNKNEKNDSNIINPDATTPQKNILNNVNIINSNSLVTNNNSSNINLCINDDTKKQPNNNISHYKNDKINNGNNYKDSYYLPNSERKRNKKGAGVNITQNAVKSRIDIKILYDSNIDQSLLYQYLNLFSNKNIRNHSAQKRKVHKPKINKSENKNKNSSTNEDNNDNKFTSIYIYYYPIIYLQKMGIKKI